MADRNDLIQQIRQIVREENEPLKQGQMRLEQEQVRTNKDLQDVKQTQEQTNKDIALLKEDVSVLKNGQAHNTTMLEAVLAVQEDLQKTAAREATVVTGFAKLTGKVNNLESWVEELGKDAGVPNPHKH